MIEAIKEFFISSFGAKFGVFFCAMLPIIELRGAIPLGAAIGLPWYSNFIVSIIGNLLPVPFILFFIKAVLNFMKKTKAFAKVALWIEAKAEKHKSALDKGAFLGLLLFVAIPIPGTGAWTGSLIASLAGIKISKSIVAITLGVLLAGVIMTLASYGILEFLKFLA